MKMVVCREYPERTVDRGEREREYLFVFSYFLILLYYPLFVSKISWKRKSCATLSFCFFLFVDFLLYSLYLFLEYLNKPFRVGKVAQTKIFNFDLSKTTN